MLVDIYIPRLDVSFKMGPVPHERGPIIPIRRYWDRFVRQLARYHHEIKKDELRIIEAPLWQITPEFVSYQSRNAELIYIPHKETHNWSLPEGQYRVRYYMQMVIPSIFSIDPKGWCAGATSYPIAPIGDPKTDLVSRLKSRIRDNTSKFDQPKRGPLPFDYRNYVFFPCQLPHDETIKYHSDWSVEKALETVLKWCLTHGKMCVIKGHPVNPGSMKPLRDITNRYPHVWVDNVSIHDLIENAHLITTVNSGVGLESIIHEKKVLTFGRADYDIVTYKIGENVDHSISLAYSGELTAAEKNLYHRFLRSWYDTHYDVDNFSSFEKI